MRYFLFVSVLLLSVACAPKPYKNLKQQHSNSTYSTNAASYALQFDRVLYNCKVEGKTPLGKRFSLSGLLFFKQLEDGTERIVFQNQMGATYFDFGWNQSGQFQVHQIMPQMDQPALVKTLKKDLEMLLFKNLVPISSGLFTGNKGSDYLRFDLPQKGFVYYIFEHGNIVAIENADDKRKVTVMKLEGSKGANTLAEKIVIQHLRAHFSIALERLQQDENPNNNDITEE